MNKRKKIETYFESKSKEIMTAAEVYNALFLNDENTHRQSVGSIIHNIVNSGGCVELVHFTKNKNFYRYKKVIVAEEQEFDDSHHEENRLHMMCGKW